MNLVNNNDLIHACFLLCSPLNQLFNLLIKSAKLNICGIANWVTPRGKEAKIMRFEQLKHGSNTIVRKKLYKSGKNWLVMSTLAFIGGIVTLGSSSINTVKADVTSDTNVKYMSSSSTQVQGASNTVNGNDQQNQSSITGNTADGTIKGDANTTSTAETNNGTGQSQINGTTSLAKGNVVATPKATAKSGDTEAQNQPSSDGPTTAVSAASAASTPTTTTDIDQGDGWRIDSNHVLHFTSSDTALISDNPDNPTAWQDSKYQGGPDAITSIVFDNKVTAGASLSGLFEGLTAVTSIKDISNLDTKNTTDFSSMFTACMSLTSLDLTGLDTSSGTNFSDMFTACQKLQSLNISTLDTSKGANFEAMFNSCYSLKSLDLSHINMSNLDYSGYGGMLGGANIDTLKLGPTDKLIIASGLADRTDSSDTTTGWTSDAYKTAANPTGFYTSAGLTNLYDGINGKDATWNVYPGIVNFKVEYVDNTDPDNPITYTDPTTYSGRAGSLFTLNRYLPGYQMIDSDADTITATIPDKNNGTIVYNTTLTPYAPVMLKITESYLDGPKTNSIKVPMKVYTPLTDYSYTSELLNGGNEWSNVDLDKSKILFGSPDGPTFSQVISSADNVSSVNNLMNLILKRSIGNDYVGDNSNWLINPGYAGRYFGFDIVYKKGGVVHYGGNSDSTPSPEITEFNQNIATFGDRPAIQVYDTDGSIIDDKIAPDTAWHSDKQLLLNGITYDNVSTDKWVKDSDVYIYFVNNADIRTYQGTNVTLTDGDNGKIINRELQPGSNWYTDRIALLDSEKYYRVATSEFVKVPAAYEYKYEPTIVETNKNTVVYDELGNILNVQLPFTEYQSDISVNIYGGKYYRIATNQFISANNI